jgi:thiamine kinase-like enzyme
MTQALDQAIKQVPFLAAANDIQITPLSGGITNKNYMVESSGPRCVIRITGANTDLLGIRRDVEYLANLNAGKLGVAPEVLYYIEPEGYLVTRFIDGKHITYDEMGKLETLQKVANKIRTYHRELPPLGCEFNVFNRIAMLTNIAKNKNCKFPDDFEYLQIKVKNVEQILDQVPYIPAPCHNDLLNLNFLLEQDEIRILDWEYSGMGDIFFDLANFSHHHALGDEQVKNLLHAYFGEVTQQSFARLKLVWPMSEIHEALWGTVQSGISELNEDFLGYANLWFGRAREVFQDSRWADWCKSVLG